MFATYDIVMLVVFAGAILFGFWKGLAWQIASVAAIFVSYLVSLNFRGVLSGLFKPEEPWSQFASMAILYLGTSLAIWIGFGFVRRSIEKFQLKEFDRQSGALLGAVKGALLCMIITMFATTLPGDTMRRAVIQSRSGNLIASSINRLSAVVPPELHKILDPYVKKLNDRLTESLPPQAPNQQSPWVFNQPVANDGNRSANPIQAQFELPVSFSTGSQGGIQVNLDRERLLNQGAQALQNGLNEALKGTTGGQPQR